MATTRLPSLRRPPPLPNSPFLKSHHQHRRLRSSPFSFPPPPHHHGISVRAFRRSDFDGFTKKVASGEALRDAWRSANDGFEQILFESRVAAQRLDRRFSISTRLSDATRYASGRARELDRELGIGRRWKSFSVDLARNWPRYRKDISSFLETPLGKSSTTIFFLWFALSGWLFRILFLASWVLPLAAPLLIGAVANNLIIQGSCPACKNQFVGYRNQVIRCANCRNIVWQPREEYSRGRGAHGDDSTSEPDIIDIEIEEK